MSEEMKQSTQPPTCMLFVWSYFVTRVQFRGILRNTVDMSGKIAGVVKAEPEIVGWLRGEGDPLGSQPYIFILSGNSFEKHWHPCTKTMCVCGKNTCYCNSAKIPLDSLDWAMTFLKAFQIIKWLSYSKMQNKICGTEIYLSVNSIASWHSVLHTLKKQMACQICWCMCGLLPNIDLFTLRASHSAVSYGPVLRDTAFTCQCGVRNTD